MAAGIELRAARVPPERMMHLCARLIAVHAHYYAAAAARVPPERLLYCGDHPKNWWTPLHFFDRPFERLHPPIDLLGRVKRSLRSQARDLRYAFAAHERESITIFASTSAGAHPRFSPQFH
jgi:hypothetical protein